MKAASARLFPRCLIQETPARCRCCNCAVRGACGCGSGNSNPAQVLGSGGSAALIGFCLRSICQLLGRQQRRAQDRVHRKPSSSRIRVSLMSFGWNVVFVIQRLSLSTLFYSVRKRVCEALFRVDAHILAQSAIKRTPGFKPQSVHSKLVSLLHPP